jgi:DNA-binding CsgD family transcriptional regulator
MKKQLSPREKEVLQLASIGDGSKEIGAKLFISHYTVKVHILKLKNKLGAKNIAHAVRIGIEQGGIALSDMAVAYVVERNKMQNKFLGAIDEHVEQNGHAVDAMHVNQLASTSRAISIGDMHVPYENKNTYLKRDSE